MKSKFLYPILVIILPFFASAQAPVDNLITAVKRWVGALTPILVGLALVFFIWSLIKLIRSESDDDRAEAKKGMWWGILAMFVIISIWGITTAIGRTLGIDPKVDTTYPRPPA
ncbi:MAG: pilin [Patescibacteria group bacterium]